jgi:hypothetical protein
MTDRKRPDNAQDFDAVFDDVDALIACAQASFTRAARTEVENNDRLGIPTHGSINGTLVTRQAPPHPT